MTKSQSPQVSIVDPGDDARPRAAGASLARRPFVGSLLSAPRLPGTLICRLLRAPWIRSGRRGDACGSIRSDPRCNRSTPARCARRSH